MERVPRPSLPVFDGGTAGYPAAGRARAVRGRARMPMPPEYPAYPQGYPVYPAEYPAYPQGRRAGALGRPAAGRVTQGSPRYEKLARQLQRGLQARPTNTELRALRQKVARRPPSREVDTRLKAQRTELQRAIQQLQRRQDSLGAQPRSDSRDRKIADVTRQIGGLQNALLQNAREMARTSQERQAELQAATQAQIDQFKRSMTRQLRALTEARSVSRLRGPASRGSRARTLPLQPAPPGQTVAGTPVASPEPATTPAPSVPPQADVPPAKTPAPGVPPQAQVPPATTPTPSMPVAPTPAPGVPPQAELPPATTPTPTPSVPVVPPQAEVPRVPTPTPSVPVVLPQAEVPRVTTPTPSVPPTVPLQPDGLDAAAKYLLRELEQMKREQEGVIGKLNVALNETSELASVKKEGPMKHVTFAPGL